MKTEMILKEIAAKGEITERQISLLRHDGTPRKDIYLGFREIEIIKSAEPNQFTFEGFYDDGYGRRANYLPVYEICDMEYIANSRRGKIYVIG